MSDQIAYEDGVLLKGLYIKMIKRVVFFIEYNEYDNYIGASIGVTTTPVIFFSIGSRDRNNRNSRIISSTKNQI